jgi:hypothetical protein
MAHYAVRTVELEGIAPQRLLDAGQLAVAVVGAAGAMGMSADGPPVTRSSPSETSVALLCREGHVILHAVATEGVCLIDLAGHPGAQLDRGLEVIARRLGATLP